VARPGRFGICIGIALVLSAACSPRSGPSEPGAAAPGAAASRAAQRAAAEAPAPSRLEVLRAGAYDPGFERALAVRPFEFPRDHGPHPAFRHEWWYFTGHLRAADGSRFGFELTFFRVALEPPPGAASGRGQRSAIAAESHWRARQIYVAHFAITDVGREVFHSTQRFSRDALGLAGAQAEPFRIWLDGWSVAQQGAAGEWALSVGDSAYSLSLSLRPLSPPVLNGNRGLSVKSDEPGAASYYYSIPRLETRGRLLRAGRPLDVSGTAWLDREWGSGSLGPGQQGWDWFALELSDGSALMFYALRDADGALDAHSAGTWTRADGTARTLASTEVSIEVMRSWISPSGARYPARWRVRVASLGLDVTVTPVLADQELDTTPRYWEGEVDIAGTREQRPLSGQGYVELVGYARE
jgi:predicted secreted hydrolase